MLEIKSLTKTYKGTKRAVDDLSINLAPGDLCGFIGHNGAGKTTTLKCAAGILDFEIGEILVGGKCIRRDPLGAKRQLAFLPDEPMLYQFMTGIQFLTFICDIYEVDNSVRQERIAKYASELEIEFALGDLVSSYSHGMKQKLALVSGLVRRPKLLMLDEPFVGLDPKASFALKTLMADFCSAGGAIFFSTHVLDVAEKLCNKIAIISGSKLIAAGDTDTVRGDKSLESMYLEMADNA